MPCAREATLMLFVFQFSLFCINFFLVSLYNSKNYFKYFNDTWLDYRMGLGRVSCKRVTTLALYVFQLSPLLC